MSEKEMMTTKEAAQILGLTTRRVVGLCHEGLLKDAIQQGRSWQISEESVYSYLDETYILRESTPMLSCSVGNTSYKDVALNSYYVDKTLLIRDLIDDQVPVILFTRPRRFGKTLALDMLKTYFEKSNEDTSVYFKGKKIWLCGDKYRKYQGSFPVISISFKDAKYTNWEKTYEAIKNILRNEFLRHDELFSSSSLNPAEKDYLTRLMRSELSEVDYAYALQNLSRMLKKHYDSKALILIDEYDTPIQQGHTQGFYDEVIQFMRNFMSAGLKDNESVAFSVLTGILRVSKENLFSGLNNPIINTVLDEKYSNYFGFTKDEVASMAAYYGQLSHLKDLQEWYDGYRFGETEIYNPWSVVNYFYHNCTEKPYWTNTSDNAIIHEILSTLNDDTARDLFSLLQGESIPSSLHMDVIYPHISDGNDTIFSFLLMTGYLKPVGKVTETDFGSFTELTLPNREIRRVYNTEIFSWIRSKINGNIIDSLEKAIYTKDEKALKESLRNFMSSCISNFDGNSEAFYHGMMLGLAAGVSSKYYIRSNRESGKGRFDLMFEPKTKDDFGIVMEFKAVKDESVLYETAKATLKQIDEKEYTAELKDRGIREIVKYGIAFCGKSVEILMNQEAFV